MKWENNDYIVKGIGGYGGDKTKDIIGKNKKDGGDGGI